MQMDRRSFLKLTALSSAGVMLFRSLAWAENAPAAAIPAPTVGGTSHFTRRITMARFPEKRSLILLTDRPPQLETPISIFKQDITPNDAFFVRWHESAIPTAVDLRTFRLTLGGRLGHAHDEPAAAPAGRRDLVLAAAPGLLGRVAAACLLAGFGFLTVAEAGWAHAIGVVALFGFIAAGFAGTVPALLEGDAKT